MLGEKNKNVPVRFECDHHRHRYCWPTRSQKNDVDDDDALVTSCLLYSTAKCHTNCNFDFCTFLSVRKRVSLRRFVKPQFYSVHHLSFQLIQFINQ